MLTGLRFDNAIAGFLESVISKQTGKLRRAKGILKGTSGKFTNICLSTKTIPAENSSSLSGVPHNFKLLVILLCISTVQFRLQRTLKHHLRRASNRSHIHCIMVYITVVSLLLLSTEYFKCKTCPNKKLISILYIWVCFFDFYFFSVRNTEGFNSFFYNTRSGRIKILLNFIFFKLK